MNKRKKGKGMEWGKNKFTLNCNKSSRKREERKKKKALISECSSSCLTGLGKKGELGKIKELPKARFGFDFGILANKTLHKKKNNRNEK